MLIALNSSDRMVRYRDAISSPSEIIEFLQWRHRHTTRYLFYTLRSGNVVDALWLMPSYVTEGELFTKYLQRKSTNGYISVDCGGFDLRILPDDVGIGRELYFTGCHEPYTTEIYREELQKVYHKTDSPTILEIGANIGYFVLEALTQCPNGSVYAIEPLEKNIQLLEENIELNGYREQVNITKGAISTRNGQTKIHLSESSNHASVNNKGDPSRKTQEVECWTINHFLDMHGIRPRQINAIRLDLEGHESGLFQAGLDDILGSVSNPFVLHIEIHPKYISRESLNEIISVLDEELELVAGYQHELNGKLLSEIQDLEQVADLPYVELVLRKERE